MAGYPDHDQNKVNLTSSEVNYQILQSMGSDMCCRTLYLLFITPILRPRFPAMLLIHIITTQNGEADSF
jgi:hypothetical protein